MILCDTNVWLALTLSAHIHHSAARRWLASVGEPRSIAFCRTTQQALLRLLSNAAVLAPYGNPPLTNAEAWAIYDAFQRDDRIFFAEHEPPGLEPIWHSLAGRTTASPKLWMDAYLAAFAIAGGYRLVTTDPAFRQFRGLDCLLLGEHG
ncbi:MAG TPA: TA system VapC family ribonuclease toxin [Candidatus Binatia bacterium]|nr:TA system VapC family ribonuclease toxin [Candidatus Binatia bacterium]